MAQLPHPSASFTDKKSRILEQLAIPDAQYTDASPKGTVDEGIRHLIDEINSTDGFVTTSSCAGRVSVFLEGRKTAAVAESSDVTDAGADQRQQVAGVGGKGAGGTWLFVSHDPVASEVGSSGHARWIGDLAFTSKDISQSTSHDDKQRRLIHFKFEPMVCDVTTSTANTEFFLLHILILESQILHVLTTSPAHAQLLLRCALQAGFRESGAINITALPPDTDPTAATPIVAIRSMGLSFESLVGYETQDGTRHRFVPQAYLDTLMAIGNERFVENAKRIARFRSAFLDAIKGPAPKTNREGQVWEDAETRKQRMREEGLKRKAALQGGAKLEHPDWLDV